MWDLSSLTRDQIPVICIARWFLNHWTPRDVPLLGLWYKENEYIRQDPCRGLFLTCKPRMRKAKWSARSRRASGAKPTAGNQDPLSFFSRPLGDWAHDLLAWYLEIQVQGQGLFLQWGQQILTTPLHPCCSELDSLMLFTWSLSSSKFSNQSCWSASSACGLRPAGPGISLASLDLDMACLGVNLNSQQDTFSVPFFSPFFFFPLPSFPTPNSPPPHCWQPFWWLGVCLGGPQRTLALCGNSSTAVNPA